MFMKMNDIKFDFVGKSVLVVGGSRGIGKEVSKQFIKAGSHVTCASRTNPDVPALNFIECDISNPQEIEGLFLGFNELDFVINVAGTNLCEPIEAIDSTEWDRVLDINLKSFFLICRHAVALMRPSGGGRIVNVSSIAGRSKSIVSGVHYTASKYGIIGLTKQLSHEVAKDNILVNCVCPSQTMTEMLSESMTREQIVTLEEEIPIRRIATTTEQALPILFLCSSGASYISGATIDINGGQL
jgi:NAD(P)-dependent dehydrogenase (short-subunit alcohol dehydrogenase family)